MVATATATATPTWTSIPTPVEAVAQFSFDPNNPMNPYPSDRLLDENGLTDLPPQYLFIDVPRTPELEAAFQYAEMQAAQLKLRGWSTFAPIRVRFDRPMAPDAGAFPRGFLLLEYDNLRAAPHPITARPYDPDNAIEVYPIVPLKPRTKYVLVVTRAVVDVYGNPARPSEDFLNLLYGSGLVGEQQDLHEQLEPVVAYLNRSYDIRSDEIVLLDLFTTQPTTDDMVAIKNRLDPESGDLRPGLPVFDRPFGNLETGIFGEGTPQYREIVGRDSSRNVSKVAIGYFEAYDFRVRSNGPFEEARVYGTKIPTRNKLDFYMVLPKLPKPPGGYPIVLFGHGLGGSGKDVGQISNIDRDIPVITIGISALQHGRRGNVTNFFNLQTMGTTREYFRQSVVDFMQVIRMIKLAHDEGIYPFDEVDVGHRLYLGGSLGGIMGTLFMAVEPEVEVGMLSVPGGGLPNIMTSRQIGQLLEPLLSLNTSIPVESPVFPLFLRRFQQTAQWALDSADPINYAPYITTPGNQLPGVPLKRILMHEGVVDSVVPNRTTDDLALAMNLPDLKVSGGCVNPAGCSGIWRFVMSDYGRGEVDGHSVTIDVPDALNQAFGFLLSDGTEVPDASPRQ